MDSSDSCRSVPLLLLLLLLLPQTIRKLQIHEQKDSIDETIAKFKKGDTFYNDVDRGIHYIIPIEFW